MAEGNSAGERSEDATQKRLKEARDKGQVARSKDLTTAILMMTASSSLYVFSGDIASGFGSMAKRAWSPDLKNIINVNQMLAALGTLFSEVMIMSAPFFFLLFCLGIFAPLLTGGLSFSTKAFAPQANRMSPAKGFKRMFGLHALVELVKALAKVGVVFFIGYLVLSNVFPELLTLGLGEIGSNVGRAMDLVARSFFLISLSLLIIAAIDVPYQLWNHAKQLKMTKQEVKDEYKETEGKPEVKSKIRQKQREMSQQRMMEAIPDADVVVTNPEHYSVAIKYDAIRSGAPIVVAKGVDLIALQIKKVAIANDVPLLAAPPLARAIYHTTEIDQEVPQGLYLAVAQVLAYIFQLRSFQNGQGQRPAKINQLEIPDELQH